MMRVLAALALAVTLASAAVAVEPGEVLDDPVLEDRARAISAELRCLVCRNESIDESSAELARDLRVLVRERLVAGDSDDEVIAFIVARYGEFVLLNPPATGSTWILWLAGPALALGGAAMAIAFIRSRAGGQDIGEALTEDEARRLHELMRD